MVREHTEGPPEGTLPRACEQVADDPPPPSAHRRRTAPADPPTARRLEPAEMLQGVGGALARAADARCDSPAAGRTSEPPSAVRGRRARRGVATRREAVRLYSQTAQCFPRRGSGCKERGAPAEGCCVRIRLSVCAPAEPRPLEAPPALALARRGGARRPHRHPQMERLREPEREELDGRLEEGAMALAPLSCRQAPSVDRLPKRELEQTALADGERCARGARIAHVREPLEQRKRHLSL